MAEPSLDLDLGLVLISEMETMACELQQSRGVWDFALSIGRYTGRDTRLWDYDLFSAQFFDSFPPTSMSCVKVAKVALHTHARLIPVGEMERSRISRPGSREWALAK